MVLGIFLTWHLLKHRVHLQYKHIKVYLYCLSLTLHNRTWERRHWNERIWIKELGQFHPSSGEFPLQARVMPSASHRTMALKPTDTSEALGSFRIRLVEILICAFFSRVNSHTLGWWSKWLLEQNNHWDHHCCVNRQKALMDPGYKINISACWWKGEKKVLLRSRIQESIL